MCGLVFATLAEAAAFLELVSARLIREKPFPCYLFTLPQGAIEGILVISGVGKVAAALATQYLFLRYQPKAIINVGICGAVVDSLATGQIFLVSQAHEDDLDGKFSHLEHCDFCLPAWMDLPRAKLATRDIPVYEPQLRARIAQGAALVDMEGAAVSRACALHDVPYALLKGITDFADPGGEAVLKENLQQVATKLATVLLAGLEDWGKHDAH